MTINNLNNLSADALKSELTKCCGATTWVDCFAAQRPFKDESHLFDMAAQCWFIHCNQSDWLEAFKHHPKIGDINSLRAKYANTKAWASDEQSGVNTASEQTLLGLADGNEAYEKKFGYIFIVCATGKSAEEMLEILNTRLVNTPEKEMEIAMKEQHKITEIRLKKLLNS